MPHQPDPRAKPNATPDCSPSLAPLPSPNLSTEQIQRWAEIIADGRDRFPTDLAPRDHDRLLEEVRHRRRDRLIRHIARIIALDMRGLENSR